MSVPCIPLAPESEQHRVAYVKCILCSVPESVSVLDLAFYASSDVGQLDVPEGGLMSICITLE